ncbi:MAG TPA: hypothetical protein VH598_04460 [Verrucomicrobiae bacterium]|nr:hypothetical protein [Verrucomicrobiae bacterium]
MTALLISPGNTTTALEKRARLDFVIIHPVRAAAVETLAPASARQNGKKRNSILDPAVLEMAMHPASLREWGINE